MRARRLRLVTSRKPAEQVPYYRVKQPRWVKMFTEFSEQVTGDERLTDFDVRVLFYLVSQLQAVGREVHITPWDIGKHTRTCERSAQRSLARLEKAGLIKRMTAGRYLLTHRLAWRGTNRAWELADREQQGV